MPCVFRIIFLLFALCGSTYISKHDLTIVSNTKFLIESLRNNQESHIRMLELRSGIIPRHLYNNVERYHIHYPVEHCALRDMRIVNSCVLTTNHTSVCIKWCYTMYDNTWLLADVFVCDG